MKSVIYEKFGSADVMKLKEMDLPKPKGDEVLIKVMATTINSGDLHMRSGKPFAARLFAGPFTPRRKILGTTFAGEVVGTGEEVSKFAIGDQVFGSFGNLSGTHTQYLLLSENGRLVKKPKELSYEAAATLSFGPQTAKYFLEKAGIKAGMKILVLGASGGVGASVVQMAKHYQTHVTGVCSTSMRDYVSNLGADEIIDYRLENVLERMSSYDIIFDTTGKYKLGKVLKKLNEGGTYIPLEISFSVMFNMMKPQKENRKVLFDVSKVTVDDLNYLGKMTIDGDYKPLIEKTYPLEKFKEAHLHAEKGSKRGSIVLNPHQ